MKSTGIIRNLDELGRVVIPKEIRKKLNIGEKDPIEIYQDGDAIVLKKYQSGCIFCGNSKDLTLYDGKLVCKKCLDKLSAINSEKD